MKHSVAFKIFNEFVPNVDVFPPIEVCDFIKNQEEKRISYFYQILQVANKNLPGFIHECPYQGSDFHVDQLQVPNTDLPLWINGEFRVMFTFYNDEDSKILQVTAQGLVKRDLRDAGLEVDKTESDSDSKSD